MKPGKDYVGIFVGTFVHDGAGNYLFGLRTEKCRDEQLTWDLAGGGTVEWGEELKSTVIREVEEEVKATPLEVEFLGLREVFRGTEENRTHWIGFDYKVLVDPKQVGIGEPDMCSELVWRPLTDIPSPKQSQMEYKVTKYLDKL